MHSSNRQFVYVPKKCIYGMSKNVESRKSIVTLNLKTKLNEKQTKVDAVITPMNNKWFETAKQNVCKYIKREKALAPPKR